MDCSGKILKGKKVEKRLVEDYIFHRKLMNIEKRKTITMRLKENWINIGRVVRIGHLHYLQNGFTIYRINKLERRCYDRKCRNAI